MSGIGLRSKSGGVGCWSVPGRWGQLGGPDFTVGRLLGRVGDVQGQRRENQEALSAQLNLIQRITIEAAKEASGEEHKVIALERQRSVLETMKAARLESLSILEQEQRTLPDRPGSDAATFECGAKPDSGPRARQPLGPGVILPA